MDETRTTIKDFLEKAKSMFPELSFKCGYGTSASTYIIEVNPLSEFSSNEQYTEIELKFTHEFEAKYAGIDLIFVSDNDLCRIVELLFEVGYTDPEKPEFINSYSKFNFENNYWSNNESHYALAA